VCVFWGGGGGKWGEMNQSLYAHMNNKRKMKKKRNTNRKNKNKQTKKKKNVFHGKLFHACYLEPQ
jgi:hypothetical protein